MFVVEYHDFVVFFKEFCVVFLDFSEFEVFVLREMLCTVVEVFQFSLLLINFLVL